MKREITKTRDKLINMFKERDPDIDAELKADEFLSTEAGRIRYFVNLINFNLSDIPNGLVVKTPCKYFDNLNQAIIFQLKCIISRAEEHLNMDSLNAKYTYKDLEDMYVELRELAIKYPEYMV